VKSLLTIAYAYLPGGLVADQLWQIRHIDAGLAVEPQNRVKNLVHVSEGKSQQGVDAIPLPRENMDYAAHESRVSGDEKNQPATGEYSR
jgi:hypothetical protein